MVNNNSNRGKAKNGRTIQTPKFVIPKIKPKKETKPKEKK